LKGGEFPPIIQALGSLIAADVAVWLVVPFTELPFCIPQQLETWAAIFWLGVIGSFFGYLMFFYLLKSIGPTRTAFVTYRYPLVGVFAGAVFLGEQIHLRMLAGGAVVLLSVLIVNGALRELWRKMKTQRAI
jgi:drug/metabolite transporter (DMT)-like permease